MSRFWRKDRFRFRKYFDRFPMRSDQAHCLGYYISFSYGWWDVNFSDGRFWDYLNKLIYRVAKNLRIAPSKVTAEVLSVWIMGKCKRGGEATNRNERIVATGNVPGLPPLM